MAATAHVNSIRQQLTTTPNGQIVQTYIVNFSVGEQGPFTAQFPATGFTAATVKAELQKTVDEINKLMP